MQKKILVSNVGSTSLKFKFYEMPEERLLCEAKVERVGSSTDAIYHYQNMLTGERFMQERLCVPSYTEGIRMFLDSALHAQSGVMDSLQAIGAVGFKTVLAKGYPGVHLLNQDVLDAMQAYLFVAPGHNGPYLEAIGQFQALLPEVPMVGVFETAFHKSIPLERRLYPLPYEWYEQYGLMRLGYHGASHAYAAEEARRWPGEHTRIISCHLGGSCSVCAIRDGVSVDNSFGFSLQTGIPHSSRAGDADAYIIPFLINEGMTMEEVLQGFGKRGGLLGISGISGDLRDILDAQEQPRAKLAVDVFVTSILRHIGAYYVELEGLDKLIFTGGIGEHSAAIRERVCGALAHLGVELDAEKNLQAHGTACISTPGSSVSVLVITANEELGVARATYRCAF